MNIQPFHVAVPVHDLDLCKKFYTEMLGCTVGRTDQHWIDLDLFGHQFVLHYKEGIKPEHHYNEVDSHAVPVPHYGVVLEWNDWKNLADKLKEKNINFVIDPYIRFEEQPGEQATMFFLDPSGNALEFKAFKDINQLFAT